jgi:hypothetical protein
MGEFDLVRCLDFCQVSLQNDAIGGTQADYRRVVAAYKDGERSNAEPRGQRFDLRFERASVERFMAGRQRGDPHGQSDQSQKGERNQREGAGRNRATSGAGFWRSNDREARLTKLRRSM